jgi:hypothetical protein
VSHSSLPTEPIPTLLARKPPEMALSRSKTISWWFPNRSKADYHSGIGRGAGCRAGRWENCIPEAAQTPRSGDPMALTLTPRRKRHLGPLWAKIGTLRLPTRRRCPAPNRPKGLPRNSLRSADGDFTAIFRMTESGQKPAGQGNYPITIVQVSGDSAECQVFGKQIDIMTASLRP